MLFSYVGSVMAVLCRQQHKLLEYLQSSLEFPTDIKIVMFKSFLHTQVLQFDGHWDMVCMYHRAEYCKFAA